MRKGGGPVSKSAHRYSWELHIGPIPNGICVLHSCDNRRCVNPAHLFLGSKFDNAQDAARKGRMQRGADRPLARLTEAKVREIRWRRAAGVTMNVLAIRFGVSRQTISNVVARRAWKHVT